MKKIRTILFSALAVLAGSLVSCTEEEFQPGPQVDGAQVYFPTTTQTQYDIEDGVTSVTVPVKRLQTDGDLTVNILSDLSRIENEADRGLFSVPENVTFADGEDEVSLVISFEREELVEDTDYTVGLLLNDENNTSPYGISSLYVTVTPWPWEVMGTGSFRDDWFNTGWQGGNVERDVTIHRHKTQEGVYMIEDMYGWSFLTEFFGATQDELSGQFSYTSTNVTINCSDPQSVFIPQQFVGVSDTSEGGYGDHIIATYQGGEGTLVDGIITFPAGGLAFVCDLVPNGAPANANGLFRIVLPGYEATDYSLTASYGGMRVGSDNETATAVIDFSYGADVAGISYAFVNGEISGAALQEYVNGIVNGTLENVYEVSSLEQGAESVSVEAELTAGLYTVVAVPAGASGEPVAASAASASFYFPAMEGAVPECDIQANLYTVSEYPDAAEYVSQCPDETSLVYEITGSELSSLSGTLMKTSAVDAALALGFTAEEIIAANGSDMSDYLEAINSGEKYWDIFIRLDSGTSYTLLLQASNSYGKSAVARADLLTSDYAYSGSLAAGNYTMTCIVPGGSQDGSDFTSRNTFKVSPTEGSSTNFVVSDLGVANGMSWNAVYDPEASTLTLDGTFPGQEDRGSFFGGWVTGDNLSAYVLFTYFSDSDETVVDDPVVFGVDASGRLVSLNTNIEAGVGIVNGNQVSNTATLAVFFAGSTTISQAAASETSSVQIMQRLSSGYMSVPSEGNGCSIFRQEPVFKTANVFPEPVAAGLRTLPVKTRVCEPLPSDGVFRIRLAGASGKYTSVR